MIRWWQQPIKICSVQLRPVQFNTYLLSTSMSKYYISFWVHRDEYSMFAVYNNNQGKQAKNKLKCISIRRTIGLCTQCWRNQNRKEFCMPKGAMEGILKDHYQEKCYTTGFSKMTESGLSFTMGLSLSRWRNRKQRDSWSERLQTGR